MDESSISLDDTFEDQPLEENAAKSSSKEALSRYRDIIADALEIGFGETLVRFKHGVSLPGMSAASMSSSELALSYECEQFKCPEWAYENSPSCKDICVWLPNVIYVPGSGCEVTGFNYCCVGCVEGEYCPTPNRDPEYYRLLIDCLGWNQASSFSGIVTDCAPSFASRPSGAGFQPWLTNTSRPSTLHSRVLKHLGELAKPAPQTGFLKVQSVYDPSRYTSLRVSLSSRGTQLSLPQAGWFVTITPVRLPASIDAFATSPACVVSPNINPTSTIRLEDQSFSASIVLPEAGNQQQYWITVPDSSLHPKSPYRYANVTTPSWNVTFYRMPSKKANPGTADCGCKG